MAVFSGLLWVFVDDVSVILRQRDREQCVCLEEEERGRQVRRTDLPLTLAMAETANNAEPRPSQWPVC